MKPLVYIAGPYTNPDPVVNTRKAIIAGEHVCSLGGDVFIPHLSLLWHMLAPQPVNTWYERDLAVLRRCDALLRIPGPSTGADNEVVEALACGLPVFTEWDDRSPAGINWFNVEAWLKRTSVSRVLRPQAS